jgi:hypothetical protein
MSLCYSNPRVYIAKESDQPPKHREVIPSKLVLYGEREDNIKMGLNETVFEDMYWI